MLHNYLAFKHGNDPKQLERFEKKRQRVRQDYDTIPNDFLMLKPVIQAYHDADKDVIRGKTEQPQLTQHEGYQLKSITDLQYIDPKDNKHTIMDYKYTKNPDIYTFFNIQRQATIYFINNPKAEKIIYRCIRKPLYRKSKDEPVSAFQKRVYTVMVNHPLEWFTDKTYHRNEFDLDYLHEELEIISDDIKMRLSHPIETWIQNDSGCFAYGSWCDFLPLCDSRVTPEGLPHLYKRYNSEDKIMLAK